MKRRTFLQASGAAAATLAAPQVNAQTARAKTLRVVPLTETTPDMADMRTVVIVGSSQTRVIARDGTPYVYTPRSVPL
jgi:precorrin-3B methylase